MTVIVIATGALLAAVAAAGVIWPFGRRVEAPYPVAGPAEDERLSVLRALRDLERDRVSGTIDEEEYASLRAETETRAVATLRSLEVRESAVKSALRVREQPRWSGNGAGNARKRRFTPMLIVGGLVAAAVVSVLASSVRTRPAGEPITGGIPGSGQTDSSGSMLAFFEQRVREHPADLAARLDLAERYLQVDRAQAAIAQYLAALQIDPRNTEARATLGFVVYRAGKPRQGLAIVEQALAADPSYPEGLFYKGVILLRGLDRPADASDAFRSYLQAAPFGARRTEAQRFMAEAARKGA